MRNFAVHMLTGLLSLATATYAAPAKIPAKDQDPVASVYLSETTIAKVLVSSRGTVLSFPTKPTKVILGNNGSFGIEYVDRDIAITPLIRGARANLFVYVLGQRFTFDLTHDDMGKTVILVKDRIEESTPAGINPNKKAKETHGL